jgi:hypothetical protein
MQAKTPNVRCNRQTMDIGVEHFSLTRYTPRTDANECPHAMAPALRAVADLGANRDIHAAVTNTKKGVYPCE